MMQAMSQNVDSGASAAAARNTTRTSFDHQLSDYSEDSLYSPQDELSSPKDVSEASADSVSTNEVAGDASETEKPALDYPKVNSKGRYEYEAEFLRSLQSHPSSLKKPDLPDLDIVQQVPIPHREKQTNRINGFLPSHMAPSRNNRSLPPRIGGRNSRELRSSKPPIKIPSPSLNQDISLHSVKNLDEEEKKIVDLVEQEQDPERQDPEQSPIIRPKISSKLKNSSKTLNEHTIKEKKKSLLPLSNITENCSTKLQTIQDIEYLIERKYTIPGTNNDDEARKRCLLFLDKDDIAELVQEEICNHKTNNNFSLAYQVSAFKGNLKETIIEASRAKQLNDWLVAMSASISREFWSKITLLYAVQLENSNEFTQAAMYYSSLHRITDAVRVLLKAGLYKESLILVKNCAPHNSQLIGDILNAWAKNKESQDNLEFAAKIYAANLKPEEAARCLAERKDDPKCQSLSRILNSTKPMVINHN